MKKAALIGLGLLLAGALFLIVGGRRLVSSGQARKTFDGQQAYQDVLYQMSLGPRIPGSVAHQKIVQWLTAQLSQEGWQVEVQNGTMMGHPIQNVIARKGSGKPWIILGAHYDSRMWANMDPDPAKRQQPVPGADDGASGVAVLTGLARAIPAQPDKQTWLVFFDAEDDGEIPGWDWLLGSEYFVNHLACCPTAAVIVDMVGDANLDIYQERNSNPQIVQQIWDQAAQLGFSANFIPQYKYSMEDDHTPFLQAGIAAVDLIDFDYPYWHTTQDTADKISANSLYMVGQTLLEWLNPWPSQVN